MPQTSCNTILDPFQSKNTCSKDVTATFGWNYVGYMRFLESNGDAIPVGRSTEGAAPGFHPKHLV